MATASKRHTGERKRNSIDGFNAMEFTGGNYVHQRSLYTGEGCKWCPNKIDRTIINEIMGSREDKTSKNVIVVMNRPPAIVQQ